MALFLVLKLFELLLILYLISTLLGWLQKGVGGANLWGSGGRGGGLVGLPGTVG